MIKRDANGQWRDSQGRSMIRWRVYPSNGHAHAFAFAATADRAIRACHNAGLSGMDRQAHAVPADQLRLF
jgi:hypothetical protein